MHVMQIRQGNQRMMICDASRSMVEDDPVVCVGGRSTTFWFIAGINIESCVAMCVWDIVRVM